MNYHFRVLQALSNALAALRTLQPRTFGTLKTVVPSEAEPNCYIKCCYFILFKVVRSERKNRGSKKHTNISTLIDLEEMHGMVQERGHHQAYTHIHTHVHTYTHTYTKKMQIFLLPLGGHAHLAEPGCLCTKQAL